MANAVLIAARGPSVAPVGERPCIVASVAGQASHTGAMSHLWTVAEWDVLFTALPPAPDSRPSWDQLRKLTRVLDHSPDAMLAVWEDAERYLRGAAYGEASPALRAYLDRRH